MDLDRLSMARSISQRLVEQQATLSEQWRRGSIHHAVIDDLLDPAVARAIYDAFPDHRTMMVRRSLRELKCVAAQMDRYNPLLEEAVYAFQDEVVRETIASITGMPDLLPDSRLYAGGISLMGKDHFLNPHLDNSHDNERANYRVMNLLYYVTPNWEAKDGGHLELWPHGVSGEPVTIESRFNRLVLMATDERSWHSVCSVRSEGKRCCVSNYYFSSRSPLGHDYFHVTSFRGRPNQPLRDFVLRTDAGLRGGLRKLFPRGVVATKHIYNKR